MWKNYLKVSLRSFLRNKANFLLNITGLTAGVTACLLIASFIWHEFQYDKFYDKGDRIYRVNTDLIFPEQTLNLALSAGPVSPAMKEEIPGIVDFVRFARPQSSLLVENGADQRYEEEVLYADASVFAIFDFTMLTGDPNSALVAPYKVVLTESKARSMFQGFSPIGQSLSIGSQEYQVSGVVADPPQNTHLQFDMLLSFASWIAEHPSTPSNWSWTPFPTYVLLEKEVDPTKINNQLSAFLNRHYDAGENGMQMSLQLQAFNEVHFGQSRLGELQPVSKKSGLLFLSLIAGLILLLAVANYINLSLAAHTSRTREIGVRKTIGASASQVGLQYILEGVLLSFFSVILAVMITNFLLPIFGNWYGRDLHFDFHQLWIVGAIMLVFALTLGILSAAYPSIIAASLKPVNIFQGKGIGKTDRLKVRQAFTMGQFAISIGLLLGAMMVHRQLDFLANKDLGFEKEGKLVLDFGNMNALETSYETLKRELKTIPGVDGISFSSHVPAEGSHNVTAYVEKQDGEVVFGEMDLFLVDYDFLDLYGLNLVAGRYFSPEFSQDTAGALILSESAVEILGFQKPEDIIGLEYSQWEWQGRVIGVVEDFNYQSLHHEPGPITFQMQPDLFENMTLQLNESNISGTLQLVQNKWASTVPALPFNYQFLDDGLARQYVADQQLARMISLSSVLAILLACLGFIGLVAFTCRRLAKNIAIRKILGASERNIITGLLLDFGKPVVLAWFLAIGPTWWMLSNWLNTFAYRLPISPWLVIGSGVIVLSVVSLVVIWQSLSTVKANPVKYLSEE